MNNMQKLEDKILQTWNVTNDLEFLAQVIGEMNIPAKDTDVIMNILIGLSELYGRRFEDMFLAYEVATKEYYSYKKATEFSQQYDVNRVEVIDDNGRAYVNTNAHNVVVSFQDEGRTLKVMLSGSSDLV